jgi:hypothetical protein
MVSSPKFIRGFMTMDGELSLQQSFILANVCASIFAKADPLENQCSRDISTAAFNAAIREYRNCNGDLSNPEDD